MKLNKKIIETDILIIGGGTAGCFAALTIAENSDAEIIIAEKANIKRSGCLAAGVNALNAYISDQETPESYLEYVKNDAEGIIREDLVYSMAQRLNEVTQQLDKLGLVILKDKSGNYQTRGRWNIKINGENIKPILAQAVNEKKQIEIINYINITDYIVKNNTITGAYGFSLRTNTFYVINSKAVICTTGGASGLYRPNNPGFSKHKMWYSPFNTGAGYGMGIRAGAEMTTFEMRFIALRCKDTIAPTGTIAQGIGSQQINSAGEEYEKKYGQPKTSVRLHSTIKENEEGKGPCYLKTKGISGEQEKELYKAYLNMSPSQTLKWIEKGKGPADENVEIEGTEPYIFGGHTASGYWLDTRRETTIKGLFAAGDVAGGSPQKYVTGCLAEGKIAAESAIEYIKARSLKAVDIGEVNRKLKVINSFLNVEKGLYSIDEVEDAMQKTMDAYAGGISTSYKFNTEKLKKAGERIEEILNLANSLRACDLYELMQIHEVIDRLYVCKVLIRHLEARKETRWHSFQENAEYPHRDDMNWLKYVNSRYENGIVKILFRELIKRGETYEHKN